jgi:adenylate cyclase
VIGNVGSAERRSFTAIGDTTNLAARLQGQAEPGQVVIGAATLAALGDGVQAAPLGPLELKGKSEPVEAYVLQAFS